MNLLMDDVEFVNDTHRLFFGSLCLFAAGVIAATSVMLLVAASAVSIGAVFWIGVFLAAWIDLNALMFLVNGFYHIFRAIR